MEKHGEDIVWWESLQKGDQEAFTLLFRMYYGLLFQFGSKLVQDRLLLEDSIQELFLELWQSRSRTRVISVKAYLFKALKYKLMKNLRKKERSSVVVNQSDLHFDWSHENFLIAEQEDEEKRKLLLAAVANLSERQKEIVYLKYYHNLSYEEISDIMNINYQVARNLLHQAIKSLKKILRHSIAMCIGLLLLRAHTPGFGESRVSIPSKHISIHSIF